MSPEYTDEILPWRGLKLPEVDVSEWPQTSRLTAQSLSQVLEQVLEMRSRHALGDYLQAPTVDLHLVSGQVLTGELLDFQAEMGQILLSTPSSDGRLNLTWTDLTRVVAVTAHVWPRAVHRLSGGLMPLPLDADNFTESRLQEVCDQLGLALGRRLGVDMVLKVEQDSGVDPANRALSAELLSRICVVLHELAEVELRRVQMAEVLRGVVLVVGDAPLVELVGDYLHISRDLATGMTGSLGLADLKMALEEVL